MGFWKICIFHLLTTLHLRYCLRLHIDYLVIDVRIPNNLIKTYKYHQERWLIKKRQMQGAQILRNEAYIRYAALTKEVRR